MSALYKSITLHRTYANYHYYNLSDSPPRLWLCGSLLVAEQGYQYETLPMAILLEASTDPFVEVPGALQGWIQADPESIIPLSERKGFLSRYYYTHGLERYSEEGRPEYTFTRLARWLNDFGEAKIHFTITPLPEGQDHAA